MLFRITFVKRFAKKNCSTVDLKLSMTWAAAIPSLLPLAVATGAMATQATETYQINLNKSFWKNLLK